MIQAVFFDIDGTLIDTTTHSIPKSTITALKELRKQGYRIGIASGRDIKNLALIPDLDTSLFDGFVTSNGMCIFDRQMDCISHHPFANEDVAVMIDYATKRNLTLVFETMTDIYRINDANRYVEIANDYYQEETPPLKKWEQEPVLKISCFQELEFDFSQLTDQIPVQILASPTTTYDINVKGISKLSGIHELMRHWDLPEDYFMCFGDHENDIEMIQGAELGIAVKDALGSLRLQELADEVCESAGKDGIYTYLKSHKFI